MALMRLKKPSWLDPMRSHEWETMTLIQQVDAFVSHYQPAHGPRATLWGRFHIALGLEGQYVSPHQLREQGKHPVIELMALLYARHCQRVDDAAIAYGYKVARSRKTSDPEKR